MPVVGLDCPDFWVLPRTLSVSRPQAFADQTMVWDFYGTDGFLKLNLWHPSHVKLVGLTSRCFPYFHPQPQKGLDTNTGPGIPLNLLYLQKDLHWGVLVSPPVPADHAWSCLPLPCPQGP